MCELEWTRAVSYPLPPPDPSAPPLLTPILVLIHAFLSAIPSDHIPVNIVSLSRSTQTVVALMALVALLLAVYSLHSPDHSLSSISRYQSGWPACVKVNRCHWLWFVVRSRHLNFINRNVLIVLCPLFLKDKSVIQQFWIFSRRFLRNRLSSYKKAMRR